ncbi:hypothetical protein Tco_1505923 [Tanacetum coccineum]
MHTRDGEAVPLSSPREVHERKVSKSYWPRISKSDPKCAGAGAEAWFFLSKSNARTISFSSATSDETAWVGKIRAARPSIENGKSISLIVAIGNIGTLHVEVILVESNGYEHIRELRLVPLGGCLGAIEAMSSVLPLALRRNFLNGILYKSSITNWRSSGKGGRCTRDLEIECASQNGIKKELH